MFFPLPAIHFFSLESRDILPQKLLKKQNGFRSIQKEVGKSSPLALQTPTNVNCKQATC